MFGYVKQLGFVDPSLTNVAFDALLSIWDREKIKALVPKFPQVFEQAMIDFVKLKEGHKRNLFTPSQLSQAVEWFEKFPELWESIRPNFIRTENGKEFGGRVDDFIGRLKQSSLLAHSLGIAPALVAGVLIVGGAAAGLWAVGYIKKQSNVSKMIDGVTAGEIPSEVLVEAVKADQATGLFTGLTSAVGPLALFAAAFVVYKFTGK